MSTEPNGKKRLNDENRSPEESDEGRAAAVGVKESMETPEDQIAGKRPAKHKENEEGPAAKKAAMTEIIDVAQDLGLPVGAQIDVQGRLATLARADGRHDDGVAIRRFSYNDQEESRDVLFLSHQELLDYHTQERLPYTFVPEDDDVMIPLAGRQDVDHVVQQSLSRALANHQERFQRLPADQQAAIAQLVAEKKEKLVSLLEQQTGCITAATVTHLLQATMEDDAD